jgi:UDP-N-acetylmuramate--alanine ligase
MNIYFCGIGGVGLGPLAEIALDAGYTVSGSDPKDSLMTQQMSERGVQISIDQSGDFLRLAHEHQPVDWFVYTSALSADHPELLAAQALGIKTTKRDELLDHIVREKGLKLIAVAGTHGKTTTTSLFVWAFKQLGIPVSYSVGTTMAFGPSGHYDPTSEYFVYECDEYDRNFLQFHPYLSVIPAISYDHPDTYPTKEEYLAAFEQFLAQSEGSILWKADEMIAENAPNAWILGDDDSAPVTLRGEHVRRNASLVVKAFERLGLPGDVVAALNEFPGVDRRFEKLVDNIYTDYAIHPREIAATLKLAHEISDTVVAVYEPHQNVRQYEVRDEYTDCFARASEVYWLPTYLTREKPGLHLLTPEELTENLTNHQAVHYADLNDELWASIMAARDRGALVLCMGAGTIDGWLREKVNLLTAGRRE